MKNKEEKLMYYTYGLDMVFLNIFSIVLFVVVWGLVVFFCKGEYVWSNQDSGFLFIYMILCLYNLIINKINKIKCHQIIN